MEKRIRVGSEVRVNDSKSIFYGQTGTVIRILGEGRYRVEFGNVAKSEYTFTREQLTVVSN